jgi:hypothetical protein
MSAASSRTPDQLLAPPHGLPPLDSGLCFVIFKLLVIGGRKVWQDKSLDAHAHSANSRIAFFMVALKGTRFLLPYSICLSTLISPSL